MITLNRLCDKYEHQPWFQIAWTNRKTGKITFAYSNACPMRTRAWLRVRKIVGLWPVKFRKMGELKALTSRLDKHRPVEGALSIGHPDISAGTLGVFMNWKGGVYAYTDNHVAADSNNGVIGDAVLQPGPHDGGRDPEDEFGKLAAFVPIKFDGSANQVDAALVGPLKPGSYELKMFEANYPTKTFGAGTGNDIFKDGRTSGVREGRITGDNARANIGYGDNRTATYTSLLVLEPRVTGECTASFFACLFCFFFNFSFCGTGRGPPVLEPGDSGSAILINHRGETKYVGTGFAGNDEISLAFGRDEAMASFEGMTLAS